MIATQFVGDDLGESITYSRKVKALTESKRTERSALKKTLALFGLAVAAIGLLLGVAGAVGVWLVKEPIANRADHVFERISKALTLADEGLGQIKKSLSTAAERLETAKREQRENSQQARGSNTAKRMFARTVHQRIAPKITNAHDKLHTVAEAAVVVNSILDDLRDFSFLSEFGLEVGDLSAMNNTLTQVESSAWELGRLLADPDPESDAGSQMSRIEQTLGSMNGSVTGYEAKVAEVRKRTDELESKAKAWITPAAVIISVICIWFALSQICLLNRAWACWKRPPLADRR